MTRPKGYGEWAPKDDTLETVFMHVGDYDPSGESIFNAMAEDVTGFIRGRLGTVAGAFRPVRVALTEDQVIEHDLPTAPAKESDTRSRNWVGETCQAEAMPPDLPAETVHAAVEDEYDLDVWENIIEAEKHEGDEIRAELDRLRGES